MLILGGLAAVTTGTAQTVNVTVAADQTVRIVDERVFGANAVMWDYHAATAQTITLLSEAGLRTIRIPGGSLSNEYHWRVNKSGTNTWTWITGFPKFIELITGVGTQTFLSVNYGTGTPEEAAAWVAYANASSTLLGTAADVTIGVDAKGYDWKTAGYWSALRASTPLAQDDEMNFLRIGRAAPVGLKYWEIGNENYGSWEHDDQVVPRDPYTYGVRSKEYMAKMRAVDPTIEVGVVVINTETLYANNTNHPATNPRTGMVHNGWTPVLLSTLKAIGAQPDFAIYHRYDQAPGQESDAFLLQSSSTWPNDVADLRQQLTDYMGANGASVELVVTENNSVYSDGGKQTTSLVNGLFLADSIANVLQTEINALMWWAIRNGPSLGGNMSDSLYGWRKYSDYGLISGEEGTENYYDTYPTYFALKLLSRFARGGDAVVTATSSSDLLAVYAVRRTDQSLSLLVINKSPTATQTGNFAVSGHLPAGTANVTSFGIPQDEAARTGTGSRDLATSTLAIAGVNFSASFAPYSATVIALPGLPAHTSAVAGGAATLRAATSGTSTFHWQHNGTDILSATASTYEIGNAQPANAGLYTARVTSGSATTQEPAIFGISSTAKLVGTGTEYPDIAHANGNIYDQILLEDAAATIAADHGQILRMSFIDGNDDIVQVEFAGAGSVSVVLDELSGPAAPVKYNQDLGYRKGHAGIVITGADETTNLTVFAVGTVFAPNPALYKNGISYDGRADLAYIAIQSTNGKFGGLRTGNVRYSGAKGTVGVYAPGVQFTGPVVVGDIEAAGTATPTLMIGSGSDVRVAAGDFKQADDREIKVSGFTQLQFTANIDSHSNPLPALANQGRLFTNGANVTSQVVVNP